MVPSQPNRTPSLPKMLGYGLGECANSLVMNGFFGFAMLYYTEALNLNPSLAGIALSISVFWEAVTEPVMGHLSDHTRHRFGRRHPWMLVGGLLMAVCFYFIWSVPEPIRSDSHRVFWYLLAINLLLRTGLTMFFIPYLALGFEICPDYEGRSKVQAVRQVFNMLANFAGPAMAWSIFFRDGTASDGTRILGTSQPENFVHMGGAFSLATVVIVLAVLWFTRGWLKDSRHARFESDAGGLDGFWLDMKAILLDPKPRWVLVFIFILCVDMVLVTSLQMYVYVYFMKFQPHEKSIAHGSTMVGMALGGALTAMMADVSAIHLARTGINKDGSYSAVYSLAMRLAISFALLASGWILSGIGFATDAAQGGAPTPQAIWRLGAAMLLAGPLVSVGALMAIRKYPITRRSLESLLQREPSGTITPALRVTS
ncbi:MAG: MFS transporter [Verrucomicrobia bacterium]|nr:MFS transporter [Verrucomicrobiota bacterium]